MIIPDSELFISQHLLNTSVQRYSLLPNRPAPLKAVCDRMSDCHFTQRVFQHPAIWLQRCFVVMWLVPRTAAAIWAHIRCTGKNPAPVYSVTSSEATHAGNIVCLAVTCHPHLWQNDQDLLRATAVTRGWNGHRHFFFLFLF